MKNADSPAMPTIFEIADLGFVGVSNVADAIKFNSGLTKREMFAMNAPRVPTSVREKFKQDNIENKDLVTVTHRGWNPMANCDEFTSSLTIKGEVELLRFWSYSYADEMLGE